MSRLTRPRNSAEVRPIIARKSLALLCALLALYVCSAASAARTAPDDPAAALASGPVAWYPADGNTDDVIGGNNGSTQNSMTYTPGRYGQAFLLLTNQSVDVPSGPTNSYAPSSPMSISLWAYRTDDSPQHLLGKRPACVGNEVINYQMVWQDGTLYFGPTTGYVTTSDNPLPLNR
jgi:hypothetical protein